MRLPRRRGLPTIRTIGNGLTSAILGVGLETTLTGTTSATSERPPGSVTRSLTGAPNAATIDGPLASSNSLPPVVSHA